ncbi:MAG: chemotaxis protein [Caulobacterales bacterium 32-69-10]|nr:MAG: chemotaxis protein [Caulobacterales bacterium 32-69-10]
MNAPARSPAPAPRTPSLVEGEFVFTAEHFAQIRALLYEDSGISLPESKATLVYSRLAKRLRRLGLTSFGEYCALVSGADGTEERRAMMSFLTTNVTRFFREPHHFDHLREHLPGWAAKGPVRLWSAGCSTGQEPYSMALTVLACLPNAAELDIRILATDIDPVVVGQAHAGLYPDDLVDAIPADMRRGALKRDGSGWRMEDRVRRLIAFKELNLMQAWPMRGRFQAIFCRNVAIYFDLPTQERLWGRFADALTPDGRLYIGHSERASDPRFCSDGLTVYRLEGRAR